MKNNIQETTAFRSGCFLRSNMPQNDPEMSKFFGLGTSWGQK